MEAFLFIKIYIGCVILVVITFICKWFEIFSLAILVRITDLALFLSLSMFTCLSLMILMGIAESFHWFTTLFLSLFCMVIVGVVVLLRSTNIEISRLQNGKYALVKKAVFLEKDIIAGFDSVVIHKIAAQAWRYDNEKIVHVDSVEMFAFCRNMKWGLYFPDNEHKCFDKRTIFPAFFDSISYGERTIIQSPDTVRYNVFRLWFGGKFIERQYLGGTPGDEIEIRIDLTPDGVL